MKYALLFLLLASTTSCLTPREGMFSEGGRRERPRDRYYRLYPGKALLNQKSPCKNYPKISIIK